MIFFWEFQFICYFTNDTPSPRWFARSRGQNATPTFQTANITSELWFPFKCRPLTPNSHGELLHHSWKGNTWHCTEHFMNATAIPRWSLWSRGQSGPQSPKKRKYYLRFHSSLNFSSQLPIVTENCYITVGKEIPATSWMRPRSLDDPCDREDRVAPQNSKKRKYYPRFHSSLNFSSQLPIVTENDQNEVSKGKPWFCNPQLSNNRFLIKKVWIMPHCNLYRGSWPSPPKLKSRYLRE